MTTIEISGITYNVIGSKQFTVKGQVRTELKLRRPTGRRDYFAVVYENGTMSEAA